MRRAGIRLSHSGLVPRGRMPVVSLDDANSRARCGGALAARGEDRHAHSLEVKEVSCSIWEAPFDRRSLMKSAATMNNERRQLMEIWRAMLVLVEE